VETPERLAALYLLAKVDALATGPAAWTPWRQALIRELVAKVQRVFERGEMGDEVAERLTDAIDRIRELLDGEPPEEVERFILRMPRSYFLSIPAEQIARQYATIEVTEPARAWLYREQLREILDRKQINVVSAMLKRWCTNVKRSKVEPMKQVAKMIHTHFDGVIAWAQTRQTNGFLEAINGLFQAAKRKARGYGRLQTMRVVIFLVAGNLDFSSINPHAA